jgi:hypothetical protein
VDNHPLSKDDNDVETDHVEEMYIDEKEGSLVVSWGGFPLWPVSSIRRPQVRRRGREFVDRELQMTGSTLCVNTIILYFLQGLVWCR